ncbi:hypothetical protein EBS02_07655 [bacterium]|nr:hypothetical protein [bacterium]
MKEFTTKDLGKSYLSAAQLWLQQNYDKCMQEENLGEMKKPSKDTYRKAVERAGDPDDERMARSASAYAKRGAEEHGEKFGKELKTQHDSEGGFTRPWDFKRKKDMQEETLDEIAKWRRREMEGKPGGHMYPKPVFDGTLRRRKDGNPKSDEYYAGGGKDIVADWRVSDDEKAGKKLLLNPRGKHVPQKEDPLAARGELRKYPRKDGSKYPSANALKAAIKTRNMEEENLQEVSYEKAKETYHARKKQLRDLEVKDSDGRSGYVPDEKMPEWNKKYQKTQRTFNRIERKHGPEAAASARSMEESSGDAPINQMSHKDLGDYINKHPKWVEKNREEAEDIAHEKTEDLKEGGFMMGYGIAKGLSALGVPKMAAAAAPFVGAATAYGITWQTFETKEC